MKYFKYILYGLIFTFFVSIGSSYADQTASLTIPFFNNTTGITLTNNQSDNSVDALVKILKNPNQRNQLIKKLEGTGTTTKVKKTDISNKTKDNFKLTESIKFLLSIEDKLNDIASSDKFFINIYNNIKQYNIKLVAAVLGIPKDITNLVNKKESLNDLINIVISIFVLVFVTFIAYVIEQHVTIFINNYSGKYKEKKVIDKLIYLGLTLLSSFVPVLMAALLVGVLSIVTFSFTFLFFQSSSKFILLIIKLLIVWIIFRTLLIFIKKMLLVSFVLNFWNFLEVSYKDIRDLYFWIRRFLTILLIFVLSYALLPIHTTLSIEILHKVLFIVFAVMLFWFIFKIKDKIQKSLLLLSTKTKYFYLQKLFRLLARRFSIIVIVYLVLVLRSFILSDYSSFFTFLNAVILTIILVVIHHFLQSIGTKYINKILEYDFESSINNVYEINSESNIIFTSILGGKKLAHFLESIYYYFVFGVFCLLVLQAWGFHLLLVIDAVFSIKLIKVLTQVILAFLSVVLFNIILLLGLRYKIIHLELAKNFEAVNRWLSVISLLNKPYLLLCASVFIIEILIIFGLPITTLIVGGGILILLLSFIAKDILRNFLGALVSILEDTFSINDYVKINKHEGTVESITALYVKLRDKEGNLHIIPFSTIEAVINTTKIYSYAYSVIFINDNNNLDEVTKLLKIIADELIKEVKYSILIKEPLVLTAYQDINNNKIDIHCKIKTYPAKQWEVKNAFLKRVKEQFKKHKVNIYAPYTSIQLKDANKESKRKSPSKVKF